MPPIDATCGTLDGEEIQYEPKKRFAKTCLSLALQSSSNLQKGAERFNAVEDQRDLPFWRVHNVFTKVVGRSQFRLWWWIAFGNSYRSCSHSLGFEGSPSLSENCAAAAMASFSVDIHTCLKTGVLFVEAKLITNLSGT